MTYEQCQAILDDIRQAPGDGTSDGASHLRSIGAARTGQLLRERPGRPAQSQLALRSARSRGNGLEPQTSLICADRQYSRGWPRQFRLSVRSAADARYGCTVCFLGETGSKFSTTRGMEETGILEKASPPDLWLPRFEPGRRIQDQRISRLELARSGEFSRGNEGFGFDVHNGGLPPDPDPLDQNDKRRHQNWPHQECVEQHAQP